MPTRFNTLYNSNIQQSRTKPERGGHPFLTTLNFKYIYFYCNWLDYLNCNLCLIGNLFPQREGEIQTTMSADIWETFSCLTCEKSWSTSGGSQLPWSSLCSLLFSDKALYGSPTSKMSPRRLKKRPNIWDINHNHEWIPQKAHQVGYSCLASQITCPQCLKIIIMCCSKSGGQEIGYNRQGIWLKLAKQVKHEGDIPNNNLAGEPKQSGKSKVIVEQHLASAAGDAAQEESDKTQKIDVATTKNSSKSQRRWAEIKEKASEIEEIM